MPPDSYLEGVPEMNIRVRETFGDWTDRQHTVHENTAPAEAVKRVPTGCSAVDYTPGEKNPYT